MSATTRTNTTGIASSSALGRNANFTPSLWDTANDELDPKIQEILATVNKDNGSVIDAVLEEAVTQQKSLATKRWKATIGGKEVILRDVFAKIIRWIDHFKAVGDIAVQFDSGAASLPWAAVRFLLQIAMNDKQYLEATIEGIEIVTQNIATYAAVETLYVESDFQLHDQIRSKVLGLYVHILSFLGESIQYFRHTTARRTAKGAFSTSQGERLKQIAKHDTEIRQLAKMCDSHVQQLIRKDIIRIDENVMTSLRAQSFLEFIAWLSMTPYREHHTRHSKKRLPGTTQWLTSDSRYVDWRSSVSSSLLWLRGILGSGKSSLVSAVIDDLLQVSNAQTPVLYYYCGDAKGHGCKCDAKDVMRSLLRQLTVKNEDTFEIVEQVHLEFKRREARGKVGMGNVNKLEPHECTKWIAELLQNDHAVIVIDAIDEIDIIDRHLLLKELITLRDDSALVVKMLLSSRDDTNLSQWLKGATELRLQASLTQADMKRFIGHCVSTAIDNKHLLDGVIDSAFRSELESYFLDRADGMFRWVELQLRYFCDMKSKHIIEKAISDPAGASLRTLDNLHAKIFERILQTDPLAYNIATQTFRLMLCLHETISPATLLAAASITRDGSQDSLELSDLLRICSHLVVLDDELDTIRFAHASVHEYLSRLPEFSMMSSNSAAASSCLLRCIDNPTPDLTVGVQPSRDFDVYAAMYWPLH
ncbi:hypothetical protein J3E72DRAFT_203080, partial [Bipolaris maydis]